MTHVFVEAYLHQLKALRSPHQIELLYNWLWERQAEVKSAIEQMNNELGLTEEFQLRPALPVFCVGSPKARLKIIGVNPAYRGSAALAADRYCRATVQNYQRFTLGYFCHGPQVEGARSGWWTRALNFLRLFPEYERLPESHFSPDERWRIACQDDFAGGWDIFPFWSTGDGLSRQVNSVPWLRELAISSLQAAARSGAKILLVASKEGWNMLRNGFWLGELWQDCELGEGATRITLSCCRPAGLDGNTIVVTINRQIFASAPHPPYAQILTTIKQLCG